MSINSIYNTVNISIDTQIDGDLWIGGTLHGGSPVKFDDTIQLGGLTGEGNAFACLNEEGILFRSKKPCVSAVD